MWQKFRPSHLYSGSRNETEEAREERECRHGLVKWPSRSDPKETPVWRACCSQPLHAQPTMLTVEIWVCPHSMESCSAGQEETQGGCQKLNQREKFTLPLMLQLTKVPVTLMARFQKKKSSLNSTSESQPSVFSLSLAAPEQIRQVAKLPIHQAQFPGGLAPVEYSHSIYHLPSIHLSA